MSKNYYFGMTLVTPGQKKILRASGVHLEGYESHRSPRRELITQHAHQLVAGEQSHEDSRSLDVEIGVACGHLG